MLPIAGALTSRSQRLMRAGPAVIYRSGHRCAPPQRIVKAYKHERRWKGDKSNAHKSQHNPSKAAEAPKKESPHGTKVESSSSSTPPAADQTTAATAEHIAPKSFLIGTLAGACGSLAGMGGGFVMIPLMTAPSLLRLTQHTAHGTSLFAVTATGIAGALGYGLNDVVELDTAMALAVCGMVTARLGAATTSKLSAATLQRALGAFMLCVAPLVPGKAFIAAMHHDKPESVHAGHEEMSTARRLIPAGVIGLGSGFLAGLFGVGGGAVVVPALTLATDMTHYQALGTSLCAMTMPAIVGTVTHYQKGNVAMRVAPALALGAFFGAYVGGRVGLQVPEEKLRYGFSGLMLVLGTKTLLRV